VSFSLSNLTAQVVVVAWHENLQKAGVRSTYSE